MMARILGSRILGAAYVGLGVYCLLAFLAGPAGLVSYAKLEGSRSVMAANLELLKGRNAELRAELDSLGSDADRAAREARSLGYLGKDEYELVLVGRRAPGEKRLEAGRALPFEKPSAASDELLKRLSLAASLLAFLLGLLLRPPEPQRSVRSQRAFRT